MFVSRKRNNSSNIHKILTPLYQPYTQLGRVFVETFLRLAMPLVDELFRSHKDDITMLLKNLQISTRALHHMCGHSKVRVRVIWQMCYIWYMY